MDGGRLGISKRAARICLSGLVMLATTTALRVPEAVAETVPAWPKVRFDVANTAFNTSESWLSTGNVASLAPDWSTRLSPRESPLVAGGVIYAGCEDDLFCALDATNGSVRWKTLVGPAAPSRWAALAGGVVYTTGGLSPSVMALDAGTGAVLWKTLIVNGAGGQSTPIAVAEGLVIEGWGYSLFAWDAATGIQKWVVPLPAGGAPTGAVPAGGVPAIVNGVVYVQDSTSPTLYALRATTGETLWTSPRASGQSGTPIVTAGLVIVAGDQSPSSSAGRLSAYAAAGCGTSLCQPVWRRDVAPAPSGAGAVAGGVLYQGFADGSYGAFEAATGRPLWKAATAFSGQGPTTPTGGATIANGLLFGQAGGHVFAWAAAGCGAAVCQPLWSTPIGGDTWTAGDIVVAHGRVYVANYLVAHGWVPASGELRVFSPRQNPPPPLSAPPLVRVPPAPVRTVPTTLDVPGDHLSIQRAIDASIPGDTVVVAPGIYHERLDFHGRAVEVRSARGPEVTIIDGDRLSSVVLFESRETRASVLRGFTIRNGLAPRAGGGGLRLSWASPTIAGNVIADNQGGGGNGIYATGGAPAIVGNQFRRNHTVSGLGATGGGAIALLDAESGTEVRGNVIEDNSAGHGGGLAVSTSGSMTIRDNVIRRNTAGEKGGGVMISGGDRMLLVQNVVVDNTVVGPGGGGGVLASGSPTVLANTIAGNASARASAVDASDGVPGMTLRNNVLAGPPGISALECERHFDWALPSFQANIVHNGDARPSVACEDNSISADPRFVDPGDGDYHLGRGSPAIDAGVASPLLPATDVAGAPRVVDGDGDGTATVDIGAYEGQRPLPEVVHDGFHSLTPARLLDTRSGVGAPAQRLGQGTTIDLQVTGRGGVPAAGVSSVVLNVTVTETTATSFLTVWPAGLTRPVASNLNYDAGRTVPNMVTVKVGAGGKVSLYNHSGSTHTIADVAGWYGASGGAAYTSVTPSRILDTRTGVGAAAAPVGPTSTLSLDVKGRGGVPEAGVSAVVLNVTVTEPTATSFLTAWPAAVPRPLASNLNYVAGQTVPNLVVVKVGDGGRVNLYNHAGTAHLIADVAGWFGDGADSTFTALPPARILDTRATAKPGPASVIDLQVTGRGGVPVTGVSAVVLNITVTEPTAISFLTGWPAGVARPLASNLNYVPGLTVPNLVVVKVDERGRVSLYNHDGLAHVIADIAGWYG